MQQTDSEFCYQLFLNPQKWKLYLNFIAVANILYCCVTIVLVFYYFDNLTAIGITYFSIEVLVIVFLFIIELRLASKTPTEKRIKLR